METTIAIVSGLVAVSISIGQAFYLWGVVRTEMKQLRLDQDKTDARVEKHAEELREGAVNFGVIKKTLEDIDDTLKRIDANVQAAFNNRSH